MRKKANTKKTIIDAYISVVKDISMTPTRADLRAMGVTQDMYRHHFGTISALRKAAMEMYPEVFAGVINPEEVVNKKSTSKIDSEIKKFKKFIITTAVTGQFADTNFLKSIDYYCKVNNAKLLILPSCDVASNLPDDTVEWHFDDNFLSRTMVFHQTKLNSNIHISQLRIGARQINPTTGLGRISQGKGSFIFASPKQTLEYDPVSNIKYPHARMSTGACTFPRYAPKNITSSRSAFLAENDHVIGGIIIEVEDDKIYHFRQIQADNRGGFCDLGYYYSGKSKEKAIPKLVMGDLHAGQHDEKACAAWEEMIDELSIDEVIFHDVFNGRSINHHEEEDIIIRSQLSKEKLLNLEQELKVTGDVLDKFLSKKSIKRGVVTKSNHDEWLIKWLKRGRFSKEPENFQIGCKLADAAVDGKDPLLVGIKGYSSIKNFDKLKFLDRNEDYKIAGIECGAHGDKGPNGSIGTKNNLERAYGKCVVGHSHTPGILRGVFQVGTTSLLKMGYNDGVSSWMHCSCLVYPNGQRQLINSIGGKWRVKK